MTVAELRARMSAAEFDQWRIYFALEPRGDARADFHTAQLLQLQANINRGNRAPYRLRDFLPAWKWQERIESPLEAAQRVLGQFAKVDKNGRRNRRPDR